MMNHRVPGTTRREFLQMSSVAICGVVAGALIERSAFAAGKDGALHPLMGIGFASSLPGLGSSVQITDSDRLLMPDPAFIGRGARVTVRGSRRGTNHESAIGGIALDALYPAVGTALDDYPRFRFWSVVGRDSLDHMSGPVNFTMPAVATEGLTFVARRQTPTARISTSDVPPPLEANSDRFALSLASEAGPKLQRGVYVIALRESASEAMSRWSRYSLVNENGVFTIPDAPFAYVILEIDYAE